MNREVSAYFFSSLGKHLILSGHPSFGLKDLKAASEMGYDDELIHSDMAVFLTNRGFSRKPVPPSRNRLFIMKI